MLCIGIPVENFLLNPTKAYIREGLSFPFSCKSDSDVIWYYLGLPSKSTLIKINVSKYTPNNQPQRGLYRCEGNTTIGGIKYLFYADGILLYSSKCIQILFI